ncbi:hypothetical protein Q9189_002614 [Teloschistes chrysophthalmus]
MSSNNSHDDGSDSDLGDLVLLDDVFKARAKDKVQTPLIAFPKSERGAGDFEFFTGQDLDRIIEHAARHYMNTKLKVVAVLGPTNIDWVANFFGLLRAGFAVVTLSPRISVQAIVNLMSETQCETIVHPDSPQFIRTITQVKDRAHVQAATMLRRADFDKPPGNEPAICRDIVKAEEAKRNVVILHSSGSTGLPKPIYTDHRRYTGFRTPPAPRRTKEYMTLPLTEVGVVGSSVFRPPGDKEWAYLRIEASKMEQIWTRPVADNQFEFVFLKDYPLRVESNSDDPPESYYSKDLFSPHSKIPNAWKYLGRLDDRVNLINGEKVLPLPIEGHIKRHPLIKEVVVFGVARPMPGLLAFRADGAEDLTDEEFIKEIWAVVEEANQNAEGFSQIGQDMIVPLQAGTEYPQTDKGSMIRPQMYRIFEKEINDAYDRLEDQQEGTLQLDIPDLEKHLLDLGRELIGEPLEDNKTDFFSAGMDSLRAIQMRGLMVKDLDLGGNSKKLSQNVVFETSNIENLAKHLHSLRQGKMAEVQDWKIVAKGMIQKYSAFQKHTPGPQSLPEGHVVVLTGATGGLGSHLLSQLSSSRSIAKIYCLLRGADPLSRLQESLQDRKISFETSKTHALTADLSQPSLGLSGGMYSEIQSTATHIIHAAWPVNFQLPLQSFEPHVQGLHNLLQLSLSAPSPDPMKVVFCSSVSTALGTPAPARIPETVIEDLDQVSEMGYGQSKLVGERIVASAVEQAGAQASCLRIGQVVGDTKHGIWNDREAFPSIVRSALTMGVLPQLGLECEWLPVDTLAKVVVELAGLNEMKHDVNSEATNGEIEGEEGAMELVYNINSPHTFSWTTGFLPALRAAGLEFDTVSFEDWHQRLRSLSSSSNSSTNKAAANPDTNPALKLLQYYESAFTGKNETKDGRVVFEIEKAKRDSVALRGAEDVIESGMVGKMVGSWMERWANDGEQEVVKEGGTKGQNGKVEGATDVPVNGHSDEQGETSIKERKEELKAQLLIEIKAELKVQLAELKAELLAEIGGMLKKSVLGGSNEKKSLASGESVTANGFLELNGGGEIHDALFWKQEGDRELEDAIAREAVEVGEVKVNGSA